MCGFGDKSFRAEPSPSQMETSHSEGSNSMLVDRRVLQFVFGQQVLLEFLETQQTGRTYVTILV